MVNPQKLFMLAKKKHLEAELERFMVKDTREDLKHWAMRKRISTDEMQRCMAYTFKCRGYAVRKRKNADHGMHEKSIWTAVYSRQFDQRDAANHFAVR